MEPIKPSQVDSILFQQNALAKLKVIKHIADCILAGKITLTDEEILAPWYGVENQRSMWAVIRNLAADGLGENIYLPPRPPPPADT